MKNILPYDAFDFQNKFTKTDLYQQLIKDYDVVRFDKLWRGTTPRQHYGDRRTIFTAVSFYYLQFLTSQNPTQIYDLGCGWNIFKKYIPNIIGIGAEPADAPDFFGDIHDYIDDVFIQNHQNFFQSVFSINALHFIPLSQMNKRICDFYSMIQPGGRGYLALNLARMIEKEKDSISNEPTVLEPYVRKKIAELEINFLSIDIDFGIYDEFMDGNIRLVMQR